MHTLVINMVFFIPFHFHFIMFFFYYRFKDQIHDVFKMLSADVQVILLSATMPDDVLEVSRCFMRDPVRILVQKEEVMYKFA